MSLMEEYHKRSDHGRDGTPLNGFLCNCEEIFMAFRAGCLVGLLDLMIEKTQGVHAYTRENLLALQRQIEDAVK